MAARPPVSQSVLQRVRADTRRRHRRCRPARAPSAVPRARARCSPSGSDQHPVVRIGLARAFGGLRSNCQRPARRASRSAAPSIPFFAGRKAECGKLGVARAFELREPVDQLAFLLDDPGQHLERLRHRQRLFLVRKQDANALDRRVFVADRGQQLFSHRVMLSRRRGERRQTGRASRGRFSCPGAAAAAALGGIQYAVGAILFASIVSVPLFSAS